ncbi:TetR/AcrR family transcriptional regulator [Nocardia vinacea]|uniref:TetR/AcrR family transcriptional regulator n=1 Tax=Nocardia vinacea TaxID=96468 RepID=UPI000319628C|nr:TetR/AcrR family transcriptional regulator [Nocardia vinacea]
MAGRSTAKSADIGTRQRLMAATEEIMREDGYAAATSRRVAERAGVKSALVYYYFPTMDDLFLAVLSDSGDQALERMRQALTDDDPLRVLWLINTDSGYTRLSTEWMALANHRKVIGAELKTYAERVRDIETAAVTMVLRSHGVDLSVYPPVVMAILLTGAARIICNEGAVGMVQGHDQLREFVEGFIARFALTSTPASIGPTAP